MALEQRLKRLESFRANLLEWDELDSARFSGRRADADDERAKELRSWLNHNKKAIEREVREAGCLMVYDIAPPPAIGGFIRKGVNPFHVIFSNERVDFIAPISDMIEETIGVLKSASYEEDQGVAQPAEATAVRAGFAFVAMAMDPKNPRLIDTLDAVKEACNRLDIKAERIDEEQSNERITDRMLESIRHAEYVIADLSHSKPNVYYEAGYALGTGKTPIYIAEKDTKLEFDLRDYPVLFFENYKQLKDKLEERLRVIAKRKSEN